MSTPAAAPHPSHLARLRNADRRLVRTVDAFDAAAWAGDSLLPGWTRAHVVAHLALNAEALGGALRGVVTGEPVAMYASAESRDDDIDELAAADPDTLRSRLHAASTVLAEAAAAVPEDRLGAVVQRTPGSERTFLAGDVATMRWREVEIHHADLGAGPTPADWPPDFAEQLVDQLRTRAATATLAASDVGRTWQGDAGDRTVTGTAADLGWWLSGRGAGETLTSDGELPRIEAW
ncbi:MAG: maleylpyruvate isomerase family mycothiol-dependent enzyme [Nocardioides sp.]|nr:maleylpyruvate isomerase family mycothiol-dependent enzyme [Nocardioides sp.]